MSTSSLQYVAPTGDAEDQALAPQPVVIYDLPGGTAPAFTAITGSVAGVSGANLQAILNDIATRLAAVETP